VRWEKKVRNRNDQLMGEEWYRVLVCLWGHITKIEHIFFEFKEIGSWWSRIFPATPKLAMFGSER
jgi:hypothetical protein